MNYSGGNQQFTNFNNFIEAMLYF